MDHSLDAWLEGASAVGNLRGLAGVLRPESGSVEPVLGAGPLVGYAGVCTSQCLLPSKEKAAVTLHVQRTLEPQSGSLSKEMPKGRGEETPWVVC